MVGRDILVCVLLTSSGIAICHDVWLSYSEIGFFFFLDKVMSSSPKIDRNIVFFCVHISLASVSVNFSWLLSQD